MNARTTELLERFQRMARMPAHGPAELEAMRWILNQIMAELTSEALIRALYPPPTH